MMISDLSVRSNSYPIQRRGKRKSKSCLYQRKSKIFLSGQSTPGADQQELDFVGCTEQRQPRDRPQRQALQTRFVSPAMSMSLLLPRCSILASKRPPPRGQSVYGALSMGCGMARVKSRR
jgi:hypothetical protein